MSLIETLNFMKASIPILGPVLGLIGTLFKLFQGKKEKNYTQNNFYNGNISITQTKILYQIPRSQKRKRRRRSKK